MVLGVEALVLGEATHEMTGDIYEGRHNEGCDALGAAHGKVGERREMGGMHGRVEQLREGEFTQTGPHMECGGQGLSGNRKGSTQVFRARDEPMKAPWDQALNGDERVRRQRAHNRGEWSAGGNNTKRQYKGTAGLRTEREEQCTTGAAYNYIVENEWRRNGPAHSGGATGGVGRERGDSSADGGDGAIGKDRELCGIDESVFAHGGVRLRDDIQ